MDDIGFQVASGAISIDAQGESGDRPIRILRCDLHEGREMNGSARFAIASPILTVRYMVPISEADFKAIRSARDCLVTCLALEEAFDIVVLNYVSFEQAVLGGVIESVVERCFSRADLDELRREVERHLINLLAAGQMFVSHTKMLSQNHFGRRSIQASALQDAFRDQETALQGFAAVQELRDAALHRALPITAWTYGGSWLDTPTSRRRQHVFRVSFDPEVLRGDRQVPTHLVEHLKSQADQKGLVDWAPLIREYVEGLSLALAKIRDIFRAQEEKSVALLGRSASEFRSLQADDPPHWVEAVKFSPSGEMQETVALDFEYEDRVQRLRRKNGPMINLRLIELKG